MRQSSGKWRAGRALLLTLCVLLAAPASAQAVAPLNDAFDAATSLGSGRTASVPGTNSEGTAEVGEPRHFPYDPARTSVWYSWTAPSDGSLVIRTQSTFQPTIAAYTGDTLVGLTRVRNQAQARDGGSEAIRIRVEANVTYRIAIDSWSAGGAFTISLELTDSPVNDDFADALPLVGLAAEFAGSTVAATQEPCEPVHDDNYYDPSVWFTWTAPASGGVTIDTTGSDFNAVLGIYTGDALCSLTRVGVERLTAAGVPAKRTFRAVAGTTYRIAVDGAGGRMGNYKLSLKHTPPPVNDLLADAQELIGSTPTATGTLFGATTESGESAPGGSAGATVWYSWTPATNGTASVSLPSVPSGVAYTVYTGDAFGALTQVVRGSYYAESFRARAGTTYRIAVDGGSTPRQGDFSLALKHAPAPANDDFANAQLLTGNSILETTSNAHATREAGEPTIGYSYGRASLWYLWTAPADGTVTLNTAGSAQDTVAAVYTGEALTGLANLAWSGYSGRLSFHASAGVTYRIAVDSYSSYYSGAIKLALEFRPPPANDAFASATPLAPAANATAAGHTLGATAETGEPSHFSYENARHSVWYSWVSPSDGALTIKATSDHQPILAAYTGDAIGSLTRVRNQAQDWDGGPEQIRVRVEAGRTYYVAVDARYNFPGTFSLSLTLVPHPANDDFEDAVPLSGLVAEVAGSTLGATQELCEPIHDDNYYDPSVWFTWTAPESGAVTLDTLGSDFPTVLGIYTGDRLCDLLRVPLRRMSQAGAVAKRGFRAVAGKTYRIAVDGVRGKMGNYKLSLEHSPPPANDLFVDAQKIDGASAIVDGTNFGATSEAPEPGSPDSASVWYEWTAPTTGLVKLEFPKSDFTPRIAAYTGDTVDTRKLVTDGGYYYWRPISFRSEAGTTYRFAVSGDGATQGDFQLKVTSAAGPPNDDFAKRVELEGNTGRIEGSTLGATSELGEPYYSYGRHASAWYEWTAPSTGLAVFNLSSTQGANEVYAFTGENLGALKGLNYYGWSGLRFRAVEGVTYRIAVVGEEAVDRGAFALAWEMKPPPPNDAFANAIELSGVADNRNGTTVGGSMEEGEPAATRYWYSDGASTVWYSWKAPSSGLTSVSASNGSVAAYRGDKLASLQRVTGAYTYSKGYFRATEGETYWIRVENSATSIDGAFALALKLTAPPANDDFANAATLSGPLTTGTTLGATSETGEPVRDEYRRASVWYTWTPTETGTAVFTLTKGSYHSVNAYTGDSLDSLQRRGSARYGALRFRARAGTTYRIVVDSEYSDTSGAFELKSELLPGPANDDIADAGVLTGTTDSAEGSNVNATLEPDEPYHYSHDASVWYRWTAPANGRVSVDLSGSSFNTQLGVYSGSSIKELRYVGYDDDSGEGSTSRASVPVRAGTTYSFRVSGYYGATGAVKLALSLDPAPANDDFAASVELTGAPVEVTGTNTTATREPSEPGNYDSYYASGSVWYHWTAPRGGRATVDLAGTGFNANVGVYEGTAVGALTKLVSQGGYYGSPKVSFSARRGRTYRISVDGYYGATGSVKLALTQEPGPANDDIADAQAIAGTRVSTTGNNAAATWEPDEPNANSYSPASVWYRWTPASSGVVKLTVRNAAFTPRIAAHAGIGFSGHVATGYGSVRFYASAGTTYSLGVLGTYSGAGGSFTLELEQAEAPPNDLFAKAQELVGPALDVTGNTIAATQEPCEPVHDDNYYDPSVWYHWTAPSDGKVTLDTAGSDFTTVLGIYTGDALCSLSRVTVERLSGAGVPAKRAFRALEGTTYRIAVDGAQGYTGHFKLALRFEPDVPPKVEPEPQQVQTEPEQLQAAPEQQQVQQEPEQRASEPEQQPTQPEPEPEPEPQQVQQEPEPEPEPEPEASAPEQPSDPPAAQPEQDDPQPSAPEEPQPSVVLPPEQDEEPQQQEMWTDPNNMPGAEQQQAPEQERAPEQEQAPESTQQSTQEPAPEPRLEPWSGTAVQPETPPAPPAPPPGIAPGPSPPAGNEQPDDPLSVLVALKPQKLGAVITRGLAAEVACTSACQFELSITLDPTAARKLSLRGSKFTVARMSGHATGRPAKFKLKLPSGARAKLKRLAALPVTVTVTARSGAETATETKKLTLKR